MSRPERPTPSSSHRPPNLALLNRRNIRFQNHRPGNTNAHPNAPALRAARRSTRLARQRSPRVEGLEERQLLAALGAIPDLNVPALQGYTQPLDGSGTTDPQTFSATSSNPDISVSIISTTFWTVGVSYTDPSNSHNSFTGTLTFALFGILTPKTVAMITEFTTDGYYTSTSHFINRVSARLRGHDWRFDPGWRRWAGGQLGPERSAAYTFSQRKPSAACRDRIQPALHGQQRRYRYK